jgi:phosphoribosylformylglycinamidine (FGAM) synthase-like amidotransferase family enzyme
MRMTLAALSERAAAENRKCCAMMTHPERTSSASFLAQVAQLYNTLFSL